MIKEQKVAIFNFLHKLIFAALILSLRSRIKILLLRSTKLKSLIDFLFDLSNKFDKSNKKSIKLANDVGHPLPSVENFILMLRMRPTVLPNGRTKVLSLKKVEN